jgi:hypothetical protein
MKKNNKLPCAKMPLAAGKNSTDMVKYNDEYVGKNIDARRHPEEQIVPRFSNELEDPLFDKKPGSVWPRLKSK